MITNRNNADPKIDTVSEILDGLSLFPKSLPCKFFYDEKGSELFEQICALDEYYLTRTEMKIMENNIAEILSVMGKNITLIELGSGSSKKTRLLFDNLPDIRAYVPIDISDEYLLNSANSIRKDYPWLKVIPVCADFTNELTLDLSAVPPKGRRIIFYPGSTIGNFTPEEARVFFKRLALIVGEDGGILVGVDLKKERQILQKAYNDSKGITAKFNLNILNRLNREFGADFNLQQFRHKAVYNETLGRIEMYLISLTDQIVHVCNSLFEFKRNERILTEYSYKYIVSEFEHIVDDSFKLKRVWTDKDSMFSIQYYNKP